MSSIDSVQFVGATGEMLSARLHHAVTGRARAYALFAHCFTCSKDLHATRRISEALAQRGVATLRFDFTGLGESEGDFAATHFSSNVGDLLAAAEFLRERYQAPSLLVGHSLGGTAVLAAAGRVPECTAVATIGAPCSAEHVTHLLAKGRETIEVEGEAEVQIGGRPFRIRKAFLDDLAAHGGPQDLGSLRRALMIFHSPQDATVDVDNARQIYQSARHPKSFVSLDGADHLLKRRADAEYTASVLAAWADRYLPELEASSSGPLPEGAADAAAAGTAAELAVGAVEVSGGSELVQTIRTRTHTWLVDEPIDLGGADLGPNPYDQLLAALGACTSMTLRMVAKRKNWPLEGVRVSLSHKRVHAQDCESCEEKEGLLDLIDRTLTLHGPLEEDQRARLLAIADRCPVHRTLTNDISIRTHLEGP